LGLRLSDSIPTGERSGLLKRIATESVSSCAQMKRLTAFLELERAVCIHLLTEEPSLKS
jgi:hypothetical protein